MGLLFGWVHFFSLLYWIIPFLVTFGGFPYLAAVPVHVLMAAGLGLYPALVCLAAAKCGFGPAGSLVFLPFGWVGGEYARAHLLSGFPWELLGYSQYRWLPMIQSADVFGVYGISFLLVTVNAALTGLILFISRAEFKGKRMSGPATAIYVVCAAVLLAGNMVYGKYRLKALSKISPSSINVRIVQGNIDQSMKWDKAFQEHTIDKYLKLSRTSASDKPEISSKAQLIIWPETAMPFYFPHDPVLSPKVAAGIKSTGSHVLMGSPSVWAGAGENDYFNSAFLMDPGGNTLSRYDKVHLVPFGEYVPVWMPFVKKIVPEVGDFKTGKQGRVLHWNGPPIGTLICYEGIFPGLARQMVKNGAGLLVNMTNDAWYGRSSAPYQHFSHNVFRAVENRRPLVRAANTGISGFINASGKILETTALFEDAVISRSVSPSLTQSAYTRFGDGFAVLCLIIGAVIFGYERFFGREKC